MTIDDIRPGRLGDPDLTLATDPRADPRMVATLAAFGLDKPPAPPPVGPSAPIEDRLEFVAAAEQGFETVFAALFDGLDPVPGVTSEQRQIPGDDGDEITIYIHRPADAAGPLPGAVHLHGGGMVMLHAGGPCYARWRDELAATGMVVIGVEFRNAGGVLGNHPFPAGLDDCCHAFRWIAAEREALGIGPLIVTGESGGANLALSLALRAKRDGWVDEIAGVYAQAPYISNQWATPPPELPSLVENDGHFISCALMAVLGTLYDPSGEHDSDPTCWPLRATLDDLRGLPPHVISVNELDPLRDEGLAYYRRLLAAGVDATGRTVLGTVHTGDLMFRHALPDVYASTVNDIHRFADRR